MDFPIRWSPKAALHLEQICEYISQDSEIYASIFAKKVLLTIEDIALFPRIGRIVPEYNNPNLRERIYGNYRIVYRLKDGIIEIAAICHGAQLLEKVL
ncbi:type II toxin-antitoxin system RelE/ParE family toxin [Candidatus Desantisbacteria bacterium]|nr:type II toxin-antitoxin system RelE/ParE family toxin [Candidatus Desantisbacteria bacterium]